MKRAEAGMGTKSTETKAWRALQAHHGQVKDVHLRELFAKDPGRAERFAVEGAGLFLDYSKPRSCLRPEHLRGVHSQGVKPCRLE